VIESFVDLTYRGVSLGRRIKLSQVRPTSGYLEIPAPMPVGTQIAIATDDGVTFDATVTWVYEQVAGADRVPGMIVTPRLAADHAAAWWTSRVALPDEDLRRVTRTRPVTAPRPRSHSKPVPPPIPSTSSTPTGDPMSERAPILADLAARVTAAAGLASPAASVPSAPTLAAPTRPTTLPGVSMPMIMTTPISSAAMAAATPPSGASHGEGELPTVVMPALDQQRLERRSREDQDDVGERAALERRSREDQDDVGERAALERRSREDQDDARERAALELQSRTFDPEPVMRRTGEHDVVDDGYQTVIMASVDPAAIGLDVDAVSDTAVTGQLPAASDAALSSASGEIDAATTTKLAAAAPADLSDTVDDSAASAPGDRPGPDGPDSPDGKPPRRGWFRRRTKRS
jgi:hypothetical protein